MNAILKHMIYLPKDLPQFLLSLNYGKSHTFHNNLLVLFVLPALFLHGQVLLLCKNKDKLVLLQLNFLHRRDIYLLSVSENKVHTRLFPHFPQSQHPRQIQYQNILKYQ